MAEEKKGPLVNESEYVRDEGIRAMVDEQDKRLEGKKLGIRGAYYELFRAFLSFEKPELMNEFTEEDSLTLDVNKVFLRVSFSLNSTELFSGTAEVGQRYAVFHGRVCGNKPGTTTRVLRFQENDDNDYFYESFRLTLPDNTWAIISILTPSYQRLCKYCPKLLHYNPDITLHAPRDLLRICDNKAREFEELREQEMEPESKRMKQD